MQDFFQLVGPICIEGSTVLDFRLALTLFAPTGQRVLPNLIVQMFVGEEVVA